MWDQLKRVAKDNCAFIFFTTTKFGFDLIASNKEWFRYDLVWDKIFGGAGYLLAKKMPMRSHEMIYIFYKKLPTYNIVNNHVVTVHTGGDVGNHLNSNCYNNPKLKQMRTTYEPRLPISVLKHPKLNTTKKRFHTTEKPVDLLEWLIKYYSNEGDIILDPTMGSGSTGVACKNLNRNFIGIEMDKTIFDIADKRINI